MKLLLVLMLLFGCSSRDQLPVLLSSMKIDKNEKDKEPLSDKYFQPLITNTFKIRKGDTLEISVFGQANTRTLLKVAPDGKIYYLFGVIVQGDGKELNEISKKIQAGLTSMFNNPEVSVLPIDVKNNRFYIIGKVRKPGEYKLNYSLTLRQALSEAGGLSDGVFRGTTVKVASLKDSFLVRNGNKIDIDFHSLLEHGDTSQDIYIHPGDYIYIASGLAQEVYLLGAVKNPQPAPYNDNSTLMAVISEQGRGFTDSAYLKQVVIIRGKGRSKAFQVNIASILEGKSQDIYLEPGDIIYVPQRPFKFFSELTRTALTVFAASAGGRVGVELTELVFGEKE